MKKPQTQTHAQTAQDSRKRGLAPRSLVADDDRRSTLESLDRPRKSPAAAFVRAALDADRSATPETATATADPATATAAPARPAERVLARVPLASIDLTRRRFQYRLSRNLARLQESLLLQGQQVPVILRGAAAPYEIVSGFGRCEALALAHAQGKLADASVWADVRGHLSDREAHEISVIENEDREGLTELDRVNKAKKLKEEGYSIPDIAFVLKKSDRMIQYYLSLADAPARISDALAQGRLRPTHALVLTKFARESLGDLTPDEVEARLEALIERCARGVSVAALRSEIGPELDPAAATPARYYAQHDTGGFELRGFHYSSKLPLEVRRAIFEAVETAFRAIRYDLKDEPRSSRSS